MKKGERVYVGAGISGIFGRTGYESNNVTISRLDFTPITATDYNMNWPGPPRRDLNYSDLYHFKPIIELQSGASKKFSRDFDIVRACSGFWCWLLGDDMIGYFTATFEQGSTQVNEIQCVTTPAGTDLRVPTGSPEITYGDFWMGCTKKGYIRGNVDKDSREGDIYISISPVMVIADGISIGGTGTSPNHHVKCN